MALTSSIQAYDPRWPGMYAEEAARLAQVFGRDVVEVHHVGSTAVPDLAAKPEIDILAVVNLVDVPEMWAKGFAELGYRRGGDLSAGHRFFKRDLNGVRTHKLHICDQGHPSIADMLKFRDHLRRTPVDRARYQALKLRLERENTDGIGQYLASKAPFIDAIVAGIKP
ncbi:GrpB family protein [Phenylobacterium sp. 20VBR1]|uniref:GrpB family protein n=1 Tax=Phenylobacterium glaciei TaxID=2803784 RepID=A0A941CWL4_9CAUL|nr:GrpB family protein [Phenylobacterium glaciei]MBR7618040.1 GrpB family protein [Phenylobacterium glaciei]